LETLFNPITIHNLNHIKQLLGLLWGPETSWVVEEAEIGPSTAVMGIALIIGLNWVFLHGTPISLPLVVGNPGESEDFTLQTHFYLICYVVILLP